MKKQEANKIAGISDEAVKSKTGKTWAEWIKVLDKAKAYEMPHKDIAIYLSEKHQVPDWWCQMVTVGYEQARGLREKHERPEGYQVSASRTLDVPVTTLYAAWMDETLRARWLKRKSLAIRGATPEKSIRIAWAGKSSVEVRFYARGQARSQVTVQHSKLPNADEGEKAKAYWAQALDRLKRAVEG
jgi:uncharacterized protein YndB with AHSA1/START domain